MSFYERQEAARRQSRWLILAFAAAIALVVVVLSVVVLTMAFRGEVPFPEGVARNPAQALAVVLFWLLVIIGSSAYRGLGLRDGGGAVATALGGTRVDRTSTDPDLRRLLNVVEEMAIASGVPVPEVYLLDGESSINAFAAGHSPANAAIAVTRGTLATLTREELQGVIAHEFSHILNGDMRLNIRMIAWLFGLMAIAMLGRMLMGLARHARKEALGFVAIGAVIFMFGWVGRGLGRVIQAAVARQRERLADASAVQFTRNPQGLKGALLKIAALPAAGRLGSARVDEVAHMLFVPGLRGLLATHPPIGERIVALDPGFPVGRLDELAAEYRRAWDRLEAARTAPAAAGQGGASETNVQRLDRLLLPAVAAQIADQVGNPGTLQISLAHELRLSLPPSFTAWSESPARACALMLATLLSRDPAQRATQRAAIDESLGSPFGDGVEAAAPLAATLPPLLRLPAVCELFPALRRLPRDQRIRLAGLVGRLAMVDHDVDVFEFCLQRLVYNSLVDALEARAEHGAGSLSTSFAPLGILFSVLATHGAAGAASPEAARAAFDAGLAQVLPGAARRPELSVPPEWPRRLWAALSQLEKLQPLAKRRLVEALVVTISHDEQLAVAEAELLRTVCAVLHCPLPPLLPKAVVGRA